MDHHLILGAGSGIGAALARRLAGPGVTLILHTGRNAEGLAAIAAEAEGQGAQALTFTGDLGAAETFATLQAVLAGLGAPLAGLCLAAGYARRGTIAATDPEALATALNAMPVALHRLAQIAAPHLADQRGRLVVLSAFGPHRPRLASFAATAPAKAALEAQIRALAYELAPRGITCNAVAPGLIAKPPGSPSSLSPEEWAGLAATVPLGRLGQPQDIAALAAFLMSAPAGYITGQVIHADGGLML